MKGRLCIRWRQGIAAAKIISMFTIVYGDGARANFGREAEVDPRVAFKEASDRQGN